jgi:amidase
LGRKLKDDYEEVLTEYDVLILPTTSFAAKRRGLFSTPIKTADPTLGLTANTVQFDATGQPAFSIPIGWLPAKEDPEALLPVAMLIVSRLWGDDKVLKAGCAWEKTFNWKMVKPAVIKVIKGHESEKAVASTDEA